MKVNLSPRPLMCQALRGFDVWRVVTALLLDLTNLPLAIAQNQSAAVEQYNRANVLLKEGDLAGAQLEIEKVLKEFPNVPEALNLAGIISEVQGEHQQAIDYFGGTRIGDVNQSTLYYAMSAIGGVEPSPRRKWSHGH